MGRSDQLIVLTKPDMGVAQDEATTRNIWLWNKADSTETRATPSGPLCYRAGQRLKHLHSLLASSSSRYAMSPTGSTPPNRWITQFG
ncbi:hypothetical protein E2C01_032834 [Portunus trituberculatus]|uniref:Uncharacterized protein n=1 Tax=Portunus trituberculatus TaxID=210409 RepID=A0A5B7F2J1_PORTR|nr:hypothetical protein [Portunus trituberculatus]